MTKSLKTIITVIGALSIIAGVFSFFNDAEFSSYFSSIFIGVTLIGTAYFYKEQPNPKP